MRILLVSNYFFPSNNVGAIRATRLYEYLKAKGHSVSVVTFPLNYNSEGNDRWDFRYSEKDINRVPSFFLSPTIIKTQRKSEVNTFILLLKKLNIAKIDVHIFWVMNVIRFIIQKKMYKNLDFVITTSPHDYNHFVGYLFKKVFSIKWVADYRDGWTLRPDFNPSGNKAKAALERTLERAILKKCDVLTAASPSLLRETVNRFQITTKNRLTILNGFDRKYFELSLELNGTNSRTGKFVILYFGSFDRNRSPIPFLNLLRRFLERNTQFADLVEVEFVTYFKRDDPDFEKILFNFTQRLPFSIKWTPFMPYERLICYVKERADILLLCLGDPEKDLSKYNAWVLAKVFDYLLLRKPILGILPSEGDTAQIIRETLSGECIDPLDYEGFEQILLFMLTYRHNLAEKYKFKDVKKYMREEQFKKLEKVLLSLA